MALKLKISNSGSQTNKLKIVTVVSDSGLLSLDSSVYLTSGGSNIDMTGSKTIKWKMWVDKSQYVGPFPTPLFHMKYSTSEDELAAEFISSDRIQIDTASLNDNSQSRFTTSSLSSYYGKILSCEIKKTTKTVIHFKIDDVSITGTLSSGTRGLSGGYIAGVGSAQPIMDGAAIWDVEIINDSGPTTMHNWIGYPDGNTNAAWDDQVAAIDFTISTEGTHIATTRNITGVGGGSASSKLLFKT